MKTIISILIAALLGAGLGVGLAYGWRLYDDSRYVCNYTTATVGAGGTVYDLALKHLKKQDRYDLDEMIFYIIEENGLGNSRYLFLQPGDVLRIPVHPARSLKKVLLPFAITSSATTPPIPTYTLTFSPGRQQSTKLQHNRRT